MKPFSAVLLLALAACSTLGEPSAPAAAAGWRAIATPADRERLREWRSAFVDGLRAARAAGHGDDVAREGRLLEPDAALGGPIPDGDYRCRVIKLGAKTAGLRSYNPYPFFHCRIRRDGAVQSFAKLTGSQRQVGRILPADALRQVFLGTLVLGDEAQALSYGRDRERDVAGYVERIGDDRWRLIMPRPAFESQIDVMELVPIVPGERR